MKWENIDDKAKRIVLRITAKLAEEQEEERDDSESLLVEDMLGAKFFEEEMARRGKYDGRKAFRRLQNRQRGIIIRRISAVACSVLILVGISWLFWMKPEALPVTNATPGERQVVLQLSGGKQIVLGGKDSLRIDEKGEAIQVNGGLIAYNKGIRKEKKEMVYNTLLVPRGGEFRVELSDGTIVHLNADSELKYPVAFSEKERKVFLKGEAWFEVTKNSESPFYVMTDDIRVKVLGTSFNVNTHGMKSTQAVLVEGSIGVKAKNTPKEIHVHPGQMAEYRRESGEIWLKEVDMRQYTAWKEGIFYFNDETLEDIMGELTRWYDMEVFFRSDAVKALHFSGYLRRYEDIRKILATVTESTGVKFDIKDKTIIVN
ncbi:FecR family protein [Odoribacter sp. AF15-53]|uniref:FecR family protein n=1 Tax=Odoribacter sp. AF15-53 TaxID=2292236 RepID=UPI000E547A69|nr:FecR domain-containing protein [Odoribacter sp. AF15-53]RHR80470.1 FecR family protein [Odoribacter sp. AF15-53]